MSSNWFEEQLAIIAPREKLALAEWAEKNIVLGGDTEIKGPYRISNAPYAEAVFELVENPLIEMIVEEKSAQIGFTTIHMIVRIYRAIVKGKSSLICYADEKTAVRVIEKKLNPLIDASPEIREHISRRTQYTIEFKNGTHIDIAWGSSVSSLATFEYPDIDMDEINKPGYDRASQETDPISNALQRSETYFDRLICLYGTPTTPEGNVTKRLGVCDAIYDLHVPCPHCGQYQPLVWNREYCPFEDGQYRDKDGNLQPVGQVTWSGGRNATMEEIGHAGYACGTCGSIWTNSEKNMAVDRYLMVPRAELGFEPRRVGLHIWRVYSKLGNSGNLSRLVDEFLYSRQDPEKLKGFVNNALGQSWTPVADKISQIEVLSARTNLPLGVVPENAVCISAGIDVQKGYYPYAIRAWSRDMSSWGILFGYAENFSELNHLLFEREFPIMNSQQTMKVWRAGIDVRSGIRDPESGLTTTDETYAWIRESIFKCSGGVWPCYGSTQPMIKKVEQGSRIDNTPGGTPLKYGMTLIKVNSHEIKISIHAGLRRAAEKETFQPFYLSAGHTDDYAKQIMAEEIRVDTKGRLYWRQIRKNNHFLDCEVMACAMVDQSFPRGGLNYVPGPQMNLEPQNLKSRFSQGNDPGRNNVRGLDPRSLLKRHHNYDDD